MEANNHETDNIVLFAIIYLNLSFIYLSISKNVFRLDIKSNQHGKLNLVINISKYLHIQIRKNLNNKIVALIYNETLFVITKKVFSSMFRLRVDIEVHNAKSDKQNEREQKNKNIICVGGLDFERDDFFFIFRALISKSE